MQITDLERSAASMNRISFAGARGTIACSILPVLASHSSQHGKLYSEGRAPVPEARPYCFICSVFRAHGAHFPVITRTTS